MKAQPESETLAVLWVTVPIDHAQPMAERLLEEGLIACAGQIGPIRSVFRWEGKICTEDETLLMLKLPFERCAETATRIRALHPYDVPEILKMPAHALNPDYAAWVRTVTATPA